MKKLLFTLLIVAGTFMSQAQDDSIKRFRFKSSANSTLDRNHLFSEDLDHCSGNLIDATAVETFTYNASTRQLSFNGQPQGSPVSLIRGLGLVNLFRGTYNEVNVTSSFGTANRRLLLNADTNVWE